jgi:hypothetical protein
LRRAACTVLHISIRYRRRSPFSVPVTFQIGSVMAVNFSRRMNLPGAILRDNTLA